SGSTATVIAGVTKGKAEVHARHAAHLSTSASHGDGPVIRGGGIMISAQCRQKFRVLEVLHGESKTGDRVLEYEFVERAQGFPLPGQEEPIPDGAMVLLLLDRKGRVLKALPDNAENRKAVRAALPRKDERKEQVPR